MLFGTHISLPAVVHAGTFVIATAFAESHYHRMQHLKRGDCTTQTVISGDSCASLASKCAISAADFTKYNPDTDLCSKLAPGQRVCCSAGTLPDIRPKPNSDGSCASYTVKSGDTCSAIAAANGLKTDDLATFNDKITWGWSGCDELVAQLKICLSTGSPPMPQSVENAVCGPLKPGSQRPVEGKTLANLNPCPLNSCCTRWGQCGITPEFCTEEGGPTGNPGTAPAGRNGCISNCGTNITNNEKGPSAPISIGYYESWNFARSCLNMRVDSIDTSLYTHYHWGFAAVGADFNVSLNDPDDQWPKFLRLTDVKKIVSIGGWGFSTNAETHDVLRQATNPDNADKFANAVVDFLNKNNLDGVDFDWEYPGAPDIPGIPAGLESDGPNYLAFLKLLRSRLPKQKTISIAAPASFWYLKQFPIAEMADFLDYIVYMTYDLHGQWDYGNKWSQDGCPSGSCLRSHVNLTETMYSLAMITKAGVSSNKIAVGISSYGRSFGMTQTNCTGPMCSFGGPNSTATPGFCTDTLGYISNAEISYLALAEENGTKTWYDTDSNSNILVYDDDQWVAFMDDSTRGSRTEFYKSLNFLGTVDWAVDLLYFRDDDDDPVGNVEDLLLPDTNGLPDCNATFNSVEDLDAAAGSIPDNCKPVYTIQALSASLSAAVKQYSDLMANGYDKKFKTYANAVADSAGKSMNSFINDNGTNYFSCIVTEASICCKDCKNEPGNSEGDPCAYCFDSSCYTTEVGVAAASNSSQDNAPFPNSTLSRRGDPYHQTVRVTKYVNETEPCPPDYSKRGFGPESPYIQSVYWTLLEDKADRFYADLLAETGIAKDKTVIGNYDRGNTCPPSAHMGDGDDCWASGYDYGIPMPNGYSADDVANPKDVVQKALDNSDNLVQQLSDALLDLQLDGYYGDELELVDSVSVPALLIINAVEDMAQIEDVADEIDEAKKKAIILAFIGALLFFVPIAGEVLGSIAELADIGTIIALVSVAGDVALGIYQVVDDPKNPLLGIMAIILAPLSLSSLVNVSKAANIRRGMSDDDILKLGGKIAGRMATIKKVIGTCHKAL